MKHHRLFIGWIVLLAMAACHGPGESRHDAPQQPDTSPALAAIDSLMWQQPDSALSVLIDFMACRDAMIASPDIVDSNLRRIQRGSTNETFDRHYAQLLASELLYKNYCEQTNRTELRQAVAYFDSLLSLVDSADTRGVSLQARPRRDARRATAQNMAFLAARAHYINGVGYYERDSVVEACAEYLCALATMERYYAEKELLGEKARFMALTYIRLGDLFSEHFMMESSIKTYQNALRYCQIESTSAHGMSNIYCRIGVQYNMIGLNDSAMRYYNEALEVLPENNGVIYRDILSAKALLNYQMNRDAQSALDCLYEVINSTDDEDERLTRYLTIGDIYYGSGQLDSARIYLEKVFERNGNTASRIQAAECLCNLFDRVQDEEKWNECVHYLANNKNTEGKNKALISQLEGMFQNHLNWKQNKQIAQEKQADVLRTAKMVISSAMVIIVFIILLLMRRHKRRLVKLRELEQKRHDDTIKAERLTYEREKSALSGRLKQSNRELRELREQIKQQEDENLKTERVASFLEEPIYQLIMARVKEGQFKSKVDFIYYKDYVLDKEQLLDLRMAVDYHFNQLTIRLKKTYPELTKTDLDYCCLYLLGLTDADVAALMQRAYNTVNERSSKLRKIFDCKSQLSVALRSMAEYNHLTD